jgi:hypothetical protein
MPTTEPIAASAEVMPTALMLANPSRLITLPAPATTAILTKPNHAISKIIFAPKMQISSAICIQ